MDKDVCLEFRDKKDNVIKVYIHQDNEYVSVNTFRGKVSQPHLDEAHSIDTDFE